MTTAQRFLRLPAQLSGGRTPRAVIFGVTHGSLYPGRDGSGHAGAADAIRAASQDDAALVDHWDFDLGGPLFGDQPPCAVDIGNLATRSGDTAGNRTLITTRTTAIRAAGAVPLLIGGDCSVTIPFLAGFAENGPVWVLQIDAHIDWRDEVEGERYGYSSPMRRASEMGHVAGMVQAGLRSVGSARPSDVRDAERYGSRFVTARDIHGRGVEAALEHIPTGVQVVVTLDCDSLDPSIMPGVAARTPGGLTYMQVIALIRGVTERARLVGMDLVELYPPADMDGLSALTASRILVNALGAIARQG